MPYVLVLTYPKPDLRSARSRIKQLGRLGVESVLFEGRTRVGRLGLLGIGTVGLVVKVEVKGRVHALKIRRTDSNRESMEREYGLTAMANKVGVGPRAEGWTKDVLLMEWAKGVEVDDWLRSVSGPGSRRRVRGFLHSLFNQCRKLDVINLDHGQLSNLRKHVVVSSDRPTVIDFESASVSRRPKNVTTAAQYLLVGGKSSVRVRRLLGLRDPKPVLEALRAYKADMSDRNYALLLGLVTRGTPRP